MTFSADAALFFLPWAALTALNLELRANSACSEPRLFSLSSAKLEASCLFLGQNVLHFSRTCVFYVSFASCVQRLTLCLRGREWCCCWYLNLLVCPLSLVLQMTWRRVWRWRWRSSLDHFSLSSMPREHTESCGCLSTWNMKMWVRVFSSIRSACLSKSKWFLSAMSQYVCCHIIKVLCAACCCLCRNHTVAFVFFAGDWPPRCLHPCY